MDPTASPAKTSPSPPPLARRKAAIDRAAVLIFGFAYAIALARLGGPLIRAIGDALATPGIAAGTVAGAFAGYLLADFVAGAVHWIADRHFDPESPAIGPMLIAPFRAHHDDPLSITRHDFFEVLGNNALVAIPAAVALTWAPAPSGALGHFAVALALAGLLAAVLTNLFHAWAHDPKPPPVARWLQARGLVLTAARHARHHRGAHDRAYCVTSGWLNPLLDATRFFARLDACIARLGRIPGHATPR